MSWLDDALASIRQPNSADSGPDYATLNPDLGDTGVLGNLLQTPVDPYAEFDRKRREEAAKTAGLGSPGTFAPVPQAGISGQMAMGAGGQGTPFSLAPPQPGIPPSLALAQAVTAPPSSPPRAAAQPPVAPQPVPQAAPAEDDGEDIPPNAKPTNGPPPAPMSIAGPPAPEPSFLQKLTGGLKDTVAPALMGVGAALQGDRGAMTQGILNQRQALAEQQNTQNLTAKALLAKGVDANTVAAAVRQPELLKALVTQNFGTSKYKIQKVAQDGLGGETYAAINENDPTDMKVLVPGKGFVKPEDAPGAPGGGGGLGDMSKTGPEYLATVPKAQAGILQGMVDGTIQPPSSFALAKPYWQGMLAAAKNLDPSFDANTWTSRHKMSSDMAASGNSSMGGILSNGKSAFKHLAEYTESASDLGNASHDFPGGGGIATAQNYLTNNPVMASSATRAKIGAINTNLGHFGQEATKFYSGTGGGVEERMNALKEMNPETKSSEEMASYAEKEKGLMLDRLHEKESQIRDTMGDAYLQKHPVFTPDLQRDIARIDANVARLRGSAPSAPASVASKADYDKLPAGAPYIAPDGSHRVKK